MYCSPLGAMSALRSAAPGRALGVVSLLACPSVRAADRERTRWRVNPPSTREFARGGSELLTQEVDRLWWPCPAPRRRAPRRPGRGPDRGRHRLPQDGHRLRRGAKGVFAWPGCGRVGGVPPARPSTTYVDEPDPASCRIHMTSRETNSKSFMWLSLRGCFHGVS